MPGGGPRAIPERLLFHDVGHVLSGYGTDVDKVLTALARGAACEDDLSDRWDFWRFAGRSLAQLRAELQIPPLAHAHTERRSRALPRVSAA